MFLESESGKDGLFGFHGLEGLFGFDGFPRSDEGEETPPKINCCAGLDGLFGLAGLFGLRISEGGK